MHKKQKRGFALLKKEDRLRIASLGSVAAGKSGKAHRWSSEEARAVSLKSWELRRRKI